MKFFKGVSLGDIVELECQNGPTIEISKVIGYVKSIDEKYLELSTYDPEFSKPFNNESLIYEIRRIRKCEILKKKE